MLELNNIFFSYEQGFSLFLKQLQVNEGENCFIIGKSGSGKSSVLKLISAEIKAQKGTVQFNNKEITKLNEADSRALRLNEIITVRQELGLLDYLNVLENILLPCRLNK